MKKIFILFLSFTLLQNCSRTYWKAQDNNCLSPGANYYTQEALNYHERTKHYRYHSGLGVAKFFQSGFIKQFDLQDRCRHTQVLLEALNNGDDLMSFEWKNNEKKTYGKIKLLKTYPKYRSYSDEVCRDYISFIGIKDKIKQHKFRACNYKLQAFGGLPMDKFGYGIPPMIKFSGWEFYNLKFFKQT
jgi:surface antigen